MSECAKRVLIRLPGVIGLRHVHKLHEREPGELGSDWRAVPLPVRLGKAEAEIPAGVLPSSTRRKRLRCASDRLIVPEKPSNKGLSIPHGGTRDRRRWWRKGAWPRGTWLRSTSAVHGDGGLIWLTLNGHEGRNPGHS